MAETAERQHGLLRRILAYAASRGVVKALEVGRGLLIAVLLGPGGYGAWTIFRLAMPYAGFASLGLNRGLEYEVAQVRVKTRARGEDEAAMGRTAMGFTLAVFLPLGVGLAAASAVVDDPVWALGLLTFGLALPAEQIWRYGLHHLQARELLRRYATLEVAYAAVHLAAAIGGALIWGLPGAFLGFAAASLAVVAMLRGSVPLRPRLSRPSLERMLRVGLPILLAVVPSTILATTDRWIVAGWGGTRLLGYYAFAVSVAGLGNTVAWVLRTLIYPEVYGDARTRPEGEAVARHLRETVIPFGWLFPPTLGVAAVAIGPAVELLAPQYGPAVSPARIFLFSSAALGLTSLGSIGVVAAGRQDALPVLSTSAVVVNAALSILFLASGFGLEGVAVAAVGSQAAYAAAVVWIGADVAGSTRVARRVATTLFPTLYCVVAVPVARSFVSSGGEVDHLAWVGVYLLAMLPLVPGLVWAVRETTWGPRTVHTRKDEE